MHTRFAGGDHERIRRRITIIGPIKTSRFPVRVHAISLQVGVGLILAVTASGKDPAKRARRDSMLMRQIANLGYKLSVQVVVTWSER
jgi:hypothetical protein